MKKFVFLWVLTSLMMPGIIEHFTYTHREPQCLKMRGQFSFLDLSNPKPNQNQKSFKTP